MEGGRGEGERERGKGRGEISSEWIASRTLSSRIRIHDKREETLCKGWLDKCVVERRERRDGRWETGDGRGEKDLLTEEETISLRVEYRALQGDSDELSMSYANSRNFYLELSGSFISIEFQIFFNSEEIDKCADNDHNEECLQSL